jgi:hypothetical protein
MTTADSATQYPLFRSDCHARDFSQRATHIGILLHMSHPLGGASPFALRPRAPLRIS